MKYTKGLQFTCVTTVRVSLLATMAMISPSVATAQVSGPSPYDLGSAYLPDFSYAGYDFGESDIPSFIGATTIDTTEFGVIADDDLDDSKALQEALEAARSTRGPVILTLPKGRIKLSEIVKINRSDLVIRGHGQGETGSEIYIHRPLSYVETGTKFDEIRTYLKRFDKIQKDKGQNVYWPFSEYSWTGGFLWIGPEGHRASGYLEELDTPDTVLAEGIQGERGSHTLTVTNSRKLRAGDDIEIVWFNRAGETGPLLKTLYGETDLKIGSHHWTFPERGLIRQKTVIRGINGNQVRIADPLLHPLSDAVSASLVDWSPLTNVGLEDLKISFSPGVSFGHHLEQGFNAIYFTGTRNGWVRDVTIHDADSGILTYSSSNLTFQNIETTGDREAHYAVHIGSAHNILVSDLSIRNPVRHALSVNTKSTKAVFQRTEVFQQPVLDQHAGSNHQNLFDQTIFHIQAKPGKSRPSFAAWDGSGAGYWQPGHGQFNTTYNLEVRVHSGADRSDTVLLEGIAEGPDARLMGIWGNRELDIDYRPEPILRGLNQKPDVPSLYDWQLEQRLIGNRK